MPEQCLCQGKLKLSFSLPCYRHLDEQVLLKVSQGFLWVMWISCSLSVWKILTLEPHCISFEADQCVWSAQGSVPDTPDTLVDYFWFIFGCIWKSYEVGSLRTSYLRKLIRIKRKLINIKMDYGKERTGAPTMHMYMQVHTCAYTHVHTHAHVHTHSHTHIHPHAHTHLLTHKHTHAHTHINILTWSHTCSHTHICSHTWTHTHADTHTSYTSMKKIKIYSPQRLLLRSLQDMKQKLIV